jgi:hypothetical protein
MNMIAISVAKLSSVNLVIAVEQKILRQAILPSIGLVYQRAAAETLAEVGFVYQSNTPAMFSSLIELP